MLNVALTLCCAYVVFLCVICLVDIVFLFHIDTEITPQTAGVGYGNCITLKFLFAEFDNYFKKSFHQLLIM